MDIDTNRSMSSEAAEYLHRAKACSQAAERTTDPEIREMLLRLVADLTVAALSAASSGSTPPKPAAQAVPREHGRAADKRS